MNNNRNLYDLSSKELKEKLNEEFKILYSKINYSDDNWNKLLKLMDDFNSEISQTSFPLSLYNETKYQMNKIELIGRKNSRSEIFVNNVLNALEKVAKAIGFAYNSIKFVFSIFALTIASVIITFFLHLIFGTFIYGILPKSVTPLMLQSVIASILFIAFKVLLFLDYDDKDVLNNYKTQILKFVCTIPFYACVFLIFSFINKIPVLEEIIPLFYPHMYISAFTNEFVFSPMIALIINCGLSILIYLFIKKKSDY